MSGIEIAGLALAFPVVLLGGGQRARDLLDVFTFRDLRDSLSYGGNAQLVKAYGLLRALLLLWAFFDALEIIDRIKKDVLRGNVPKSAIHTRDAMCAKYTMTAVAAAIIAQVAITALSLDQIDSTHWTAQAAFIMSLVAGSLSVFYCCMIQQTFGTLISDEDVKDWLCKPGEWQGMEEELDVMNGFDEHIASLRPGSEATVTKEELRILTSRVLGRLSGDQWKTPSINAAMMLTAPARLLYLAVVSFLAGLGIYLGSVFSNRLAVSTGKNASLANLIIYILEVVIGLLLFYVPYVLRLLEHIPGQRVRRGARDLKIMLDAYQDLDKLQAIAEGLDAQGASAYDLETGPRQWEEVLFRVQHSIRLLSHSSSAPSQEALVELEAKMQHVAKALKMHAVVNFPAGDVGFMLPRVHTWKNEKRQDAGKVLKKDLDFAEKVRRVLARKEALDNPLRDSLEIEAAIHNSNLDISYHDGSWHQRCTAIDLGLLLHISRNPYMRERSTQLDLSGANVSRPLETLRQVHLPNLRRLVLHLVVFAVVGDVAALVKAHAGTLQQLALQKIRFWAAESPVSEWKDLLLYLHSRVDLRNIAIDMPWHKSGWHGDADDEMGTPVWQKPKFTSRLLRERKVCWFERGDADARAKWRVKSRTQWFDSTYSGLVLYEIGHDTLQARGQMAVRAGLEAYIDCIRIGTDDTRWTGRRRAVERLLGASANKLRQLFRRGTREGGGGC
ncbi:hypothetical protein LTR65_002539 [Meristemomyces frigidus]